MQYTVRFAHLKYLPAFNPGNKINRHEIVGIMGSTGQSDASHLHIDVVEGLVNKIIRLSEIGYEKEKKYTPNVKQLNFFIDDELFNYSFLITTFFYDPTYKQQFGKDHPGYDIVPSDRQISEEHHYIYWNRSKPGTVLAVGEDGGYGNYILIGFEA